MNVGRTVKDALGGLVSNRCYPNTFPQVAQPTWPAIRYTVSSRDADVTLEGTDDGETDDIRVQVDFVDRQYEDAKALRALGVAAMQPLRPPCVRDTEFETYDEETKTHRFVVVFVFQPSSADQSPA